MCQLRIQIYTVSEKRANLFFVLCPPNIEISMHLQEKRLTKICKKCLLRLKYVIALHWEIWGDRLSRQRSTYIYIFKNHWIAINTTGSPCLKSRQTCSTLQLYTTCSKCPPSARTKISDVDELRWRIITSEKVWITLFTERAVGIGDLAPASTCLRSCWRQTFSRMV